MENKIDKELYSKGNGRPINTCYSQKRKILYRSLFVLSMMFFVAGCFFVIYYDEKIVIEPIMVEDDSEIESKIESYMRGEDLIIKVDTKEEQIWVDGLVKDRYSIDGKEITVYNYERGEYFKLHIGEDSDIYDFGDLDVTDRFYIEGLREKDSIETQN